MPRWLPAIALGVSLLGAPREAPSAGGPSASLTVGVVGDPGSLDPFTYTTPAAADILSATSDGLLRYGPNGWPPRGGRYAWRPDLLAAMPTLHVSGPPGKGAVVTIAYRLRMGLRWSDGRRITSRDIRFTWREVMRQHGAYRSGYDQITRVDTPTPLTAVVHLRGTYAAWQTLFSFLLPCHPLQPREPGKDRPHHPLPVSSGPFAVVQSRAGRVVLRANPHYSGQDGPRPRVARIVVRSYRSPERLRAALRSREVSVADGLQLQAGELRALRKAGFGIASAPSPALSQFTFNLSDPFAQDEQVRRAFLLALDRRGMSRRLFDGRAAVVDSDQPPYSWAFSAGGPPQRQNVALARRILRQDGWQRGPGGDFEKDGRTLSLLVASPRSALGRQILRAATAQEAKAGIRLVPTYLPLAALFGPGGDLACGRYQVALFTLYGAVDADDAPTFNSEVGNRAAQGSDFSGYQNAAVNRWTADAQARMSLAARTKDYRQVQVALRRDLPMVPLFFLPVETAFNPRAVQGVAVQSFGGSLWSANRWQATSVAHVAPALRPEASRGDARRVSPLPSQHRRAEAGTQVE